MQTDLRYLNYIGSIYLRQHPRLSTPNSPTRPKSKCSLLPPCLFLAHEPPLDLLCDFLAERLDALLVAPDERHVHALREERVRPDAHARVLDARLQRR